VSRYDKVNLVPFGEFVPWPFGALTEKISTEAGDFAAGRRVVVSPVGNNHKIGAFICYESVFPNFVRKFAAGGAEVLFKYLERRLVPARARRASSIWRLCACGPPRTAAGFCARPTTASPPPSIPPAVCANRSPYVAATSYTGFNYESEQTFYTRWGDWFPALCALLALAGLVTAWVL